MANVDMCRHEWPGSGCKECAKEAVLSPMAQELYNVKPYFRDVPQKIPWNQLRHDQQDYFLRLAAAIQTYPGKRES